MIILFNIRPKGHSIDYAGNIEVLSSYYYKLGKLIKIGGFGFMPITINELFLNHSKRIYSK